MTEFTFPQSSLPHALGYQIEITAPFLFHENALSAIYSYFVVNMTHLS